MATLSTGKAKFITGDGHDLWTVHVQFASRLDSQLHWAIGNTYEQAVDTVRSNVERLYDRLAEGARYSVSPVGSHLQALEASAIEGAVTLALSKDQLHGADPYRNSTQFVFVQAQLVAAGMGVYAIVEEGTGKYLGSVEAGWAIAVLVEPLGLRAKYSDSLAKFESPFASFLYELSLDGSHDDEAGSVDFRGHACRFGKHLLVEDDRGFVGVTRFGTEEEAIETMAHYEDRDPETCELA